MHFNKYLLNIHNGGGGGYSGPVSGLAYGSVSDPAYGPVSGPV